MGARLDDSQCAVQHNELSDQLAALEAHVQQRTAALQQCEARLANLLSLSADWIWEQDANLAFTYLSGGIETAAGIAPALLMGRQRHESLSFDAAPAEVTAYEASLDKRLPFRDFNCVLTRPDGVKRHIRTSGEPMFSAAGEFQGYRGIARDVTATVQAQAKVRELARYDSLTGLPNRSMFLTELDRAIARSKRHHKEFAVCFIDLDRFKTINDTLGHEAGDELLKTMAVRLRGAVRESDLVARLGGDEFVVLLESSASVDMSLSDLNTVAQKLLAAMGEPLGICGSTFLVTGSVGIALYPRDGHDAVTLLRRADAAMYLAKEKGKNNVQFYTAELADLAAQQFELESALRLALVRDEFVLHFQPKIDIPSGVMIGVEALVRWQHPQRGMVPPMDFIPLAEERGLIVPIGRWVMRAACRQIRDWRAAGLDAPPVAVNLSARQFASESLLTDIIDAMTEFGVAARDIEVELTESVLMLDPERAKRVLNSLFDLGVRISIDDFGTGYSSLSYLKRFPAQTVKIDRSFISGLPADKDDAAITEAVIAMAHSLGLNVVAEGVETQDQLALLRRLGCDEAQGYLMARPMNAAALVQWMAAQHQTGGAEAHCSADFVI
jgi:diguanylate cyclase (GGDEF)-like protein/PAS domain S-box-containing protein